MSKIASAPQFGRSDGPAARTEAAAPFVGEEHLRAVVVERRRVPVREVLVRDGVEPDRVRGVRDVEQDAVARAGARGEADLREHRDVVALVGDARSSGCRRRGCHPATGRRSSPVCGSAKMRGRLTISSLLRRGQRDLDDVDAEQRRVRDLLSAPGPSSRPARRRSAPSSVPEIHRCRRSPCRSDRSTSVWVCEPRHVWTAATCFGLLMSEMSKMRTPRNRPALTGVSTRCCRSRCGLASARPT